METDEEETGTGVVVEVVAKVEEGDPKHEESGFVVIEADIGGIAVVVVFDKRGEDDVKLEESVLVIAEADIGGIAVEVVVDKGQIEEVTEMSKLSYRSKGLTIYNACGLGLMHLYCPWKESRDLSDS